MILLIVVGFVGIGKGIIGTVGIQRVGRHAVPGKMCTFFS